MKHLAVFALACTTLGAFGQTYYVATNGSNSAAGAATFTLMPEPSLLLPLVCAAAWRMAHRRQAPRGTCRGAQSFNALHELSPQSNLLAR